MIDCSRLASRIVLVFLLIILPTSESFLASQAIVLDSHHFRTQRSPLDREATLWRRDSGRSRAAFLMAISPGKNNKKKKGKRGSVGRGGAGGSGGGFGGFGGRTATPANGRSKLSTPATPFDASAALLRSERLYERYLDEAAKALAAADEDEEGHVSIDTVTTEYVVAAKYEDEGASSVNGRGANAASVSDWIPVAQLCVIRSARQDDGGGDDHRHVRAAVSHHCRELYHAAVIAAPVFKGFPRSSIRYSAEPVASFHKHVYDDVIEGTKSGGGNGGDLGGLTKAEARKVLDLEDGCNDMALIKGAYRSMSFRLHPDRLGADLNDDVDGESSSASTSEGGRTFADVKLAYETLLSGVRNGSSASASSSSWYESLGGRDRTDFMGPIDLLPLGETRRGTEIGVDQGGFLSAVVGLDDDTAMAFVARNQHAAARSKS